MTTGVTVKYHADGNGPSLPAINVKDRHSGMDFVAAVERLIGGPAAGLLGESVNSIYPTDLRDIAYERVVSDFWQAATEIAEQRGLGEIAQEGRSGGWLVFTNGYDPAKQEALHYEAQHHDEGDGNGGEPFGDCRACDADVIPWLAAYRAMTEWADAYIADAPRKVAALVQQMAMDKAGEGAGRRMLA